MAANPTHEPVMKDREYRWFADLVRSYSGIWFGPDTRFLLERRVARRMRELSIDSLSAYRFELRNESRRDGELAALVDELTTNETYFFRERSQLRALVAEILPEALVARRERGPGPVYVWSAGCSSGEEPYSVVILAREAGFDPERDLRVYASDISLRMMKRARSGTYREASFRETEPALRAKYFEEKDGTWTISDAIKKSVDFIHLNLMDRSRMALLGAMDVILCRNVMIYFDADTKRDVIATFEHKLRPGGHLLLGHSESLINVTSGLELRHLKNDLVYRKPVPGLSPADPWHVAALRAIGDVERSR
ncbi:MAG TPA: protein-glutamate O-methyltransferase CheR [Myxococcota bacterium]|nr:protein-glutamate O-methyltransferase CheR [Myxococcota bacterium]